MYGRNEIWIFDVASADRQSNHKEKLLYQQDFPYFILCVEVGRTLQASTLHLHTYDDERLRHAELHKNNTEDYECSVAIMRKSLNFIFDLVILLSTTVVLIDGQCNVGTLLFCLDANCWSYSVGCTLANAFPFERKSPSTCEECMQMCRKRRQGQLPYLCQSAVYDSNYQTCDLFAVGAYFPYSLTPCPGRTYLWNWSRPMPSNPLNNAQCGGPTPAPAAVDCPAGQTAVMVYFKDSSPASPVSGGSTFAAASQDECLKFCQINQDKSGNPAPCKVAQFQNGQCTVGPNVATGNSAATIQNAVGSYYYEKQCLPKTGYSYFDEKTAF
uniref:Apple domain-containing protein n=1 Tax=Romanomermis culicivorax TaxID=13658 RepID=A0A915JQ32_ROMCU